MPTHLCQKSEIEFAIIVVYVDDLNLVRTFEELTRTTKYLKKKFEMKDLGNFFFFFVSACRLSNFLLEYWFTNQHILRKS